MSLSGASQASEMAGTWFFVFVCLLLFVPGPRVTVTGGGGGSSSSRVNARARWLGQFVYFFRFIIVVVVEQKSEKHDDGGSRLLLQQQKLMMMVVVVVVVEEVVAEDTKIQYNDGKKRKHCLFERRSNLLRALVRCFKYLSNQLQLVRVDRFAECYRNVRRDESVWFSSRERQRQRRYQIEARTRALYVSLAATLWREVSYTILAFTVVCVCVRVCRVRVKKRKRKQTVQSNLAKRERKRSNRLKAKKVTLGVISRVKISIKKLTNPHNRTVAKIVNKQVIYW